ncbi:hypothetical protein [Cupriavidus pauculus]|uniref:hypothetical protein n=1 Tax=Cupriavidus pauculus TaxID=82633 RepID=UPI001CBAA1AE|nr:hypothetical protein [Cupriavidus pauculus]MCM3609010.1 hypothetical protein [Cupriavidus pauculus]
MNTAYRIDVREMRPTCRLFRSAALRARRRSSRRRSARVGGPIAGSGRADDAPDDSDGAAASETVAPDLEAEDEEGCAEREASDEEESGGSTESVMAGMRQRAWN